MKKYFSVLFIVLTLISGFACRSEKDVEGPYAREYEVKEIWQGWVSSETTTYRFGPTADDGIGFIRVRNLTAEPQYCFNDLVVQVTSGFLPLGLRDYSFPMGQKIYFFLINAERPETQYISVNLAESPLRTFVGVMVNPILAEKKLRTQEWVLVNAEK